MPRKKGKRAKKKPAPLRKAGLRVILPPPKVETPETVYDRKRQRRRDELEISQEIQPEDRQ